MNKPSVTEGVGFINYAWPELKLRVMAERVTDDGFAELSFYSGNGSGEPLLQMTRVNLLASTTMSSLAKRLEKNSVEISWTDILTFITGKTMEITRRGEPVVPDPRYVVERVGAPDAVVHGALDADADAAGARVKHARVDAEVGLLLLDAALAVALVGRLPGEAPAVGDPVAVGIVFEAWVGDGESGRGNLGSGLCPSGWG